MLGAASNMLEELRVDVRTGRGRVPGLELSQTVYGLVTAKKIIRDTVGVVSGVFCTHCVARVFVAESGKILIPRSALLSVEATSPSSVKGAL